MLYLSIHPLISFFSWCSIEQRQSISGCTSCTCRSTLMMLTPYRNNCSHGDEALVGHWFLLQLLFCLFLTTHSPPSQCLLSTSRWHISTRWILFLLSDHYYQHILNYILKICFVVHVAITVIIRKETACKVNPITIIIKLLHYSLSILTTKLKQRMLQHLHFDFSRSAADSKSCAWADQMSSEPHFSVAIQLPWNPTSRT